MRPTNEPPKVSENPIRGVLASNTNARRAAGHNGSSNETANTTDVKMQRQPKSMNISKADPALHKMDDRSSAHSLGRVLLVRCSIVTLLGLIIYSAFEVIFDPPDNLINFVTHHFVHVLAIGLAVSVVCWMTLQKVIFSPISEISHHLSRLRFGRLDSLTLRSEAIEVETIISGINALTERLRNLNTGSLENALTSVQELRVGLSQLSVRDPDQKVPIMRSLTRLESSLLDLMCHEHKNCP